MKHLHSRRGQRFTLQLRVSRWPDYVFIGFGIAVLAISVFTQGVLQLLWAAAGIVALLAGVISRLYLGVVRMGPKGVAAWDKWRWQWINWNDLVRASAVMSQHDRRCDQLVLYDKTSIAHSFPGLQTARRLAAREGSVQWAADIINSVIAARLQQQQPS